MLAHGHQTELTEFYRIKGREEDKIYKMGTRLRQEKALSFYSLCASASLRFNKSFLGGMKTCVFELLRKAYEHWLESVFFEEMMF